MVYILLGICNRPIIFVCFFASFLPDSITFATDPTVLESVTGSVPVEQPHKYLTRYWYMKVLTTVLIFQCFSLIFSV